MQVLSDEKTKRVTEDVSAQLQQHVSVDVIEIVAQTLNTPVHKVTVEISFPELGLDSLVLLDVIASISKKYSVSLSPAKIIATNNVKKLVEHLVTDYRSQMCEYYQLEAVKDEVQEDITPVEKTVVSIHKTPQVKEKPANKKKSGEVANDANTKVQRLLKQLNDKYGISLAELDSASLQSVEALTDYVMKHHGDRIASFYKTQEKNDTAKKIETIESVQHIQDNNADPILVRDIAVIGMSGIFPDAPDLEAFWKNLTEGHSSAKEIPQSRWDWQRYYDAQGGEGKSKSKWGNFIEQYDHFDPLFFSIAPNEAALMDPQERLVLQECWKTIEDAGYDAAQLSGSDTAVYIGYETAEYLQHLQALHSEKVIPHIPGTGYYYLADRVSYTLNLKGPSEAINTGCASSSSAIHRACKAIQGGECDLALAGGVSLNLFAEAHLAQSQANLLSEDGQCRVFDEEANGYVRGEGVGIILLKELTSAQRDGDNIYGVISSSTQNNRGRALSMAGVDADALTDLIVQNYQKAQVDPNDVNYIELEGFCKPWADAIEFEALKSAFNTLSNSVGNPLLDESFCGLGSLKGNIGNLEPASGVASVIKMLLAMRHQRMPATIGHKNLNQHIDIDREGSPFYLVKESVPFDKMKKDQQKPFRAGITSVNMSGANVHLLLEEYLEVDKDQSEYNQTAGRIPIAILSAKNEDLLKTLVSRFSDYLKQQSQLNLDNMAYTLQVGRNAMPARLAIVYRSQQDLIDKLHQYLENSDNKHWQNSAVAVGDLETQNEKALHQLAQGKYKELLVKASIESHDFNQLALLWSKGVEIPWADFYKDASVKRMSLPGYVFDEKAYWVGRREGNMPSMKQGESSKDTKAIEVPEQKISTVAASTSTDDKIINCITQTLFGLLGVDIRAQQFSQKFTEWGMDSIKAIQFIENLNRALNLRLTPLDLFKHPSVEELSQFLLKQHCDDIGNESHAENAGEEKGFELLSFDIEGKTDIYNQPFDLTELQQAYHLGESNLFDLGNMIAHQYFEVEMKDFDLSKWRQAWKKLLQRHPLLKCVISPESGQWQYLSDVDEYQPIFIDYSAMGAVETQKQLQQQREKLCATGVSTDTWPLLELAVHKLAEDRYVLHYNIALVLLDGLSGRILFNELHQFYHNPDVALPALRLSVSDYMLGLSQFKQTDYYQQAKDYWLQKIDSLPAAPELPQKKKLSDIDSYLLSPVHGQIAKDDWYSIKQIAAKKGITPSMVVYTAFASVLAKWSAKPEFCINILQYNRLPLHEQADAIIGNFSSTMLLDTNLAANESFILNAQRLQQVQQANLAYSAFNGLEVQQERNRRLKTIAPGMPIVFTSLIGFAELQEFETPEQHDQGKLTFAGVQTPQVTLDCAVAEENGALQIRWAVLKELYPENLMEELLAAKLDILRRLAREPNAWDAPVMSPLPQQQQHVRQQANATWEAEYCSDIDQRLHMPFFLQANKTPEKIALISEDQSFTYAQLAQMSLSIAAQLRDMDVQANQLVAVVMEKGWEQVAAVMGILAAGGAYLPIDADYPEQRIEQLLSLGEARVVLTQTQHERNFGNRPCIVVDSNITSQLNTALSIENFTGAQKIDDLAYVIFTSGSTGVPKGVMIDHRAVCNTIVDINTRFNVTENDVALAISALNFDLSVYDIFGLLGIGGSLVIPKSEQTKDPAQLARLVSNHKVSVWNSVPSFVQMFHEYTIDHDQSAFDPLRVIMMSGDWIPVSVAQAITDQYPEKDIISLGGATECSIWSIYYPIEHVDSRQESIPYGKPLANQQFHVLNEHWEDCPDFVAGELFIGGSGLAQGYWRNPEKTAYSFVTHPLTKQKLYRTGDLGCYLPDGNIKFLGRSDNQVKINGFRIELGEIESLINQHDAIKQTLVTVYSSSAGDKQLLAYLIAENSELDESEKTALWKSIESSLREKLPRYMVPKNWMLIDALPLTANGKVDYKNLPQPQTSSNTKDDAVLKPRNAMEEKLLAIWREVLLRDQITMTDSFFDLGGHSISAVRLISKINKTFQKNLPLSMLMEHDSIAALAQQLGEENNEGVYADLVLLSKPDQASESSTPFFLIHPIGGHVMSYRDLSVDIGKTRPVYGIAQRPADQGIGKNVEQMASHYLELIRSKQKHGPYYIGGWSFGGIVAFEMVRQLEEINESVAEVILIDSWAPLFDNKKLTEQGLLAKDEKDIETVDSKLLPLFIQDLQGRFSRLVVKDLDFKESTVREDLAKLLTQLQTADESLGDLDMFQLASLFHIYRNNMQAMYRYRPSAIQSKIHVIKALDKPPSSFDQHPVGQDLKLGWSEFAELEHFTMAGDHYSIFMPPNLSVLKKYINTCIALNSEEVH